MATTKTRRSRSRSSSSGIKNRKERLESIMDVSASKYSNENGFWDFNIKTKTLEYRFHQNSDLPMMIARIDQLRSFVGKRISPSRATARNPSANRNTSDIVTLSLLKSAAERKTSHEMKNIVESFYIIYNSEQFDKFLLNLLRYFHYFWKRKEWIRKQKEDLLSKPSPNTATNFKIALSLKLLGQCYCTIIMGLGLESQHHMNCGKSRVSATYHDKKTFEVLYRFCANFIWIAYLRKDRKSVDEEIGRLLRSENFNPALRPIILDENDGNKFAKMAETNESELQFNVTKHQRDPRKTKIKSIIYQRSPVMESVFPQPKDRVPWLFEKGFSKETTNSPIFSLENHRNSHIFGINKDPKNFRYGILGEKLIKFNDNLEKNEENLSGMESDHSSCPEDLDESDDEDSDEKRTISPVTIEILSEEDEA